MKTTSRPERSFRVPNSLIQGLTTSSASGLNELPAFSITTLLGLLTLVDQDHPDREVRAKPSDILEIIEVGKNVAHVVDRTWKNEGGKIVHKRYPGRRYNPRYLAQVHEALLRLYNQSVVIQRHDPKRKIKLDDRSVHILDMFGYSYEQNGQPLDIDTLPADKVRVNVGTSERPVWRIKRRTDEGDQDERPTEILFRLNAELAKEVLGDKNTIRFTVIARRVFGVLRTLHRDRGAIRLLLLILRQTAQEFTRQLNKAMEGLGWGHDHPGRSLEHLRDTLDRLQAMRIINEYEIMPEEDRLRVVRNSEWHLEAPEKLVAAQFLASENPVFGI
jgi:hypothetical protein